MSNDSQTVVFFPQDAGNSLAQEFLLHPDFRVIAGFLLGWVFWTGICYTCRSRFFHLLGQFFWDLFHRLQASPTNAPDIEAQDAEKNFQRRLSTQSAIYRVSNQMALTFTLNVCFALAAFAEFCSLLVYGPGGNAACAFTIAWGSMAIMAARIIGLVILILELRHRGASKVEVYCLCATLVVVLSFILAFTATNTGALTFVNTLDMFLCSRSVWAPTAILSSVGLIVLELYVMCRFFGWSARNISVRAMLAASVNLQVARASSLLLLDLLTIVPNVLVTSELVQFLPMSFGAIIVLVAFNHVSNVPATKPVKRPPALPLSNSPTPLSRASRPNSLSPNTQAAIHPSRGEEVDAYDDGLSPLPAGTGSADQPAVPIPASAPPRIGDAAVFADHQESRQILPFQVQYAERLERHVHTGPIVGPIRQKPPRPRVRVVIEDVEPQQHSGTMSSSVMGSDIIRQSSSVYSGPRRSKKQWSPDSNGTPTTLSRSSDAVTPSTRTPTTFRDSSMSNGSRMVFSAAVSRQSSRKKIRSPAEMSLKMPWRSAPRSSFASGRTFGGARDELPVVVERRTEASGSRASHSSTFSKRKVISRPQSLRSTRTPSPLPSRRATQLPMVPTLSRPSSSQLLTVPDYPRSSRVLSESPSSIRPSSRYIVPTPPPPTSPPLGSYERAQGTGRLKGPRSPPMSSSAPNLRSGWPLAEQTQREDFQSHRRRSSDSCPELPSLDLGVVSLRSGPSIRR